MGDQEDQLVSVGPGRAEALCRPWGQRGDGGDSEGCDGQVGRNGVSQCEWGCVLEPQQQG